MAEKVVLEKRVNDKNITEVQGFIDNKVDKTESPLEHGVELLISLDSFGYKFSNLKLISYRKGEDSAEISKQIIQDLVDIKDEFIKRAGELLK